MFRCSRESACEDSFTNHSAVKITGLKELSQSKFEEWKKGRQQTIDSLSEKVCY